MPRTKSNKSELPADLQIARVLLPVSVAALLIIGFVMVYSTTSVKLAAEGEAPYKDVLNQVVFAAIGVVAALLVWRTFPYTIWKGVLTWIVYFVAIILLFATVAFGTEVNGARRWLYIGSFGIQPSEFLKVALLLASIRIVYDAQDGTIERRAAYFWFAVLVLVPLVILLLTQSDLGTTMICAIGIFSVTWIGGVNSRVLLGAVIVIAVGIVAMLAFGAGYRSDRLVFLNPWNDGQQGYGAGYNIIRSYYALAEGGLFGVGLGNSHEKYEYLFASDSDFIFAVIGEELGLVGALFVIALFLCILYSGLKIAQYAPDSLGAMIAAGCTIMLVFQAFLNIGCTIGVFPTTGKPLPFISSGGSSVIASLAMMGIVMSVLRGIQQDSMVYERRRESLRVVRTGGGNRGSARGGRPSNAGRR